MQYVPYEEWDDTEPGIEPPDLTVEISEPTVIATLHDVNGEPLIELMDREIIEFGYRSPSWED